MTTYISILRGINVSGQKKIKMVELKKMYVQLGLKNVITYIQSGNVIFQADGESPEPALAEKIQKGILKKFKFEVPVILRTMEEWKRIIATNPLVLEKGIDLERLHVTFLSALPEKSRHSAIEPINYPPDRFLIYGKEIYLHCPNGYGISKLSNNFFENKLKVTATTRNWRTVNELLNLALHIGN
ncbi:MAG: DUF1697 domain-containing protein [Chitinophagales bacterium]